MCRRWFSWRTEKRFKDARLRAASAADTVGARAAGSRQDDNAKGCYEHFDFEPSASDPYHLLLIMKGLLRIVGKH